MTEPKPKPIRLLYPGTFTDTRGRQHTYTDADIEAIAASYDYAANPAPLVVGHPQLDTPAWGWAAKVTVQDGELVAFPDPDRLEPAFAEAVEAGRYARISPSLYAPDDPNNPKPGGWYLKHIGFLGGAAPAVKGLGMVSFGEAESFVTLDTTQEKTMADGPADFAEQQAEIARQRQELDDRVKAFAAREQAARHQASVAFAEALIAGGKLAPAGKDDVVHVLDACSRIEELEPASFGEADSKPAPSAAFKKLFDGAGTIVAFGEHARPPAKEGKALTDPQAIADKAVAFCEAEKAAGRIVTVAVAVRKVMAEDKAD